MTNDDNTNIIIDQEHFIRYFLSPYIDDDDDDDNDDYDDDDDDVDDVNFDNSDNDDMNDDA